ncbi:hypothetical protein RRG08_028105 [Elysia crispata]|uniref:Uncharacterized protein n=1 Tax=Elysia crispata TaxID=231223 RepID=A0AAE1A5J2_9GAST|nr:hypothetical protein RRG08_028105 [Elysia crispata]
MKIDISVAVQTDHTTAATSQRTGRDRCPLSGVNPFGISGAWAATRRSIKTADRSLGQSITEGIPALFYQDLSV